MKLFVYGSLLSNFQADDLIPEEAVRRPAHAIGRLYECINLWFPAIVIPESLIQARGTNDYSKDEILEKAYAPLLPEVFDGLGRELLNEDYSWIHGEVVEIQDIEHVMPVIDKYEGFNQKNPLYHRSLVPVKVLQEVTWGWIYHFMSEEGLSQAGIETRRIYHGSWAKLIWTNQYEG